MLVHRAPHRGRPRVAVPARPIAIRQHPILPSSHAASRTVHAAASGFYLITLVPAPTQRDSALRMSGHVRCSTSLIAAA
jgi:hypothetical protein